MGRVGIYFKEALAVRPVPINSLKEYLLLEVFIGNKKRFDLYHHYIDHQLNHKRKFMISFFH